MIILHFHSTSPSNLAVESSLQDVAPMWNYPTMSPSPSLGLLKKYLKAHLLYPNTPHPFVKVNC